MDKYHDEQLYDILSARAKWGLDEDVITDDQLYRITGDVLLDAAEDAHAQTKQKSFDSLTPHQRVVYGIVREHGPVGPSEIHERYTEEVDDPRTKRTVRTYL